MTDLELFSLGGVQVTLATALISLLILLISFWISRVFRNLAKKLIEKRKFIDEKSAGTFLRIVNYLIIAVGFAVALQNLGLNLSALFAAGAIFAVGIGFAMQNIAENFVAGVILLVERSIRPSDILEVEGNIVKVVQMGLRATIVRTWDGEDLIVPNSVLVKTTVKNFTLWDSHYRLKTSVGVAYDSDVDLVFSTLNEAAQSITWRMMSHEPQVFLKQFGNSALIFEIAVWMANPWEKVPKTSDLNATLWWALKKEGLTVAYPQLDLHIDQEGLKAIRGQFNEDS